jgi:hypothetical protein
MHMSKLMERIFALSVFGGLGVEGREVLRDTAIVQRTQAAWGRRSLAACVALGMGLALALAGCGGKPPAHADRIASAAQSPSSASTPTPLKASPPEVGTTLVQDIAQPGSVAYADGTQHTVAVVSADGNETEDSSSLTTYDVAGKQLANIADPGQLDASCGVADVTLTNGTDEILTMRIVHTDAAGVQDATDDRVLSAWNALSGEELWKTTLFSTQEEQGDNTVPTCTRPRRLQDTQPYESNNIRNSLTVSAGDTHALFAFSGTGDSRCSGYCVEPDNGGPWILNLEDGSIRADTLARAVTGNYVIDAQMSDDINNSVVGPVVLKSVSDGRRLGSTDNELWKWLVKQMFTDPGQAIVRTGPDGTLAAAFSEIGFNVPDSSITYFTVPDLGTRAGPKPPKSFSEYAYDDFFYDTGSKSIIDFNRTASVAQGVPVTGKGWAVTASGVCGLKDGKVLVLANGQLAILAPATGRQISYSAYDGAGCPQLLPSGAGFDGTSIVQYLP